MRVQIILIITLIVLVLEAKKEGKNIENAETINVEKKNEESPNEDSLDEIQKKLKKSLSNGKILIKVHKKKK